MHASAIVTLEDGSIFHGLSYGVQGDVSLEIVRNTAMYGYQEVMTDPSYSGQALLFTTPHVGIVGIREGDSQSRYVKASCVIARSFDASLCPASIQSVFPFFHHHKIIAIGDIDTRAIARRIKEKGAMRCHIVAKSSPYHEKICSDLLEAQRLPNKDELYHIALIDYGVKQSIIDALVDRGCRVSVFSPKTKACDILHHNIDGITLSSGPLSPLDYSLDLVRDLLRADLPMLGICLGHQIIALALGATLTKMTEGHHCSNHPVIDVRTLLCYTTAQNHGFAITLGSLPHTLAITHRSLIDGSIAGIRHRYLPILGFQGHPEGAAGPSDICTVFDEFIMHIQERRCQGAMI